MLGWQPSWNKKRDRGVAWGATGYWGAGGRWGEGVQKIVAGGREVVSATMDNSEEEEVVVQIQVVVVGSEGVGESGGREERDGVLGGRSDQEDVRRSGGNPVDQSQGAVGGERGEEGEGGCEEGGDSGEEGEEGWEVSGSSQDRG